MDEETISTLSPAEYRAAHYPRLERERRSTIEAVRGAGVEPVELREAGGETPPVVHGYGSVTGVWYEVHDAFGPYQEMIAPDAFDTTLQQRADVRLLLDHEGLPLARTKSGTLTVEADGIGLRYEAPLEPSDPDVQRVLPKMRRGDLSDSSFAFRTVRDSWDAAYEHRTIQEVRLYDVSVVTYPANPAAWSALRADQIIAELAGMSEEMLENELRAGRMPEPAILERALRVLESVLGGERRSAGEQTREAEETAERDAGPTISLEMARHGLEAIELVR